VGVKILAKKRKAKEYERSLKLIPLLIHLPPATDDIQGGGRDERDVNEEAISQSTIMYSIIASTLKKESFNTKLYPHLNLKDIKHKQVIKSISKL